MRELRLIENELVPVYETETGEKVVYGRELHQTLQSKQDFSTWMKKRILECDAVEIEDFDRFHKKMEANNATLIEYIIKLDTAKEMAMLERNEKGKQVRRYFIQIEKKYKQHCKELVPELPSNLSPQLQLLINMELKQKEQDQKILELEDKTDKQSEALRTIKETLLSKMQGEGFNKWVIQSINSIAQSEYFIEHAFRYQEVWSESYKRLTEKARCNLTTLVNNAKKRAAEHGATKAQIAKICKLSVITSDKRLSELYAAVLKEMLAIYGMEVA